MKLQNNFSIFQTSLFIFFVTLFTLSITAQVPDVGSWKYCDGQTWHTNNEEYPRDNSDNNTETQTPAETTSFNNSIHEYHKGNIYEALNLALEAIESNPRYGPANYMLGFLYLELAKKNGDNSDYENALKYFLYSLNLETDNCYSRSAVIQVLKDIYSIVKHLDWDDTTNEFFPTYGYGWADNGNDKDYSVMPLPEGTSVKDHPNLVWTGDGIHFHPTAGFKWVSSNPTEEQDFRVDPLPEGTQHSKFPNVVWTGDGQHIRPEIGYTWNSSNPDLDKDYTVVPLAKGTPYEKYPHTVWTGDGQHILPTPGYKFVSGDPHGENDYSVIPLLAGTAHEKFPNVVWEGDGQNLNPAPGFVWSSDDSRSRILFEQGTLSEQEAEIAFGVKPDPSLIIPSEISSGLKGDPSLNYSSNNNSNYNTSEPSGNKNSETTDSKQTHSIFQKVNDGSVQEFTTLSHPLNGPDKASEQLKSIEFESRNSTDKLKAEDSKDRSDLGIDTPNDEHDKITFPTLEGSNPNKQDIIIPEEYKKDDNIIKLVEAKKVADQQYTLLHEQLKKIMNKIDENVGDKGKLQVEEANILNSLSTKKSEQATINIQLTDRIRTLRFNGVDLTKESKKNN